MSPDDKAQLDLVRKEQQRLDALKIANKRRSQMAKMKKAVRAGLIDDLELLRGNLTDYERLIAEWPIERLLKMMRHIGPARRAEILWTARVSPHKPIGMMSYDLRKHLANLVEQAREYVV